MSTCPRCRNFLVSQAVGGICNKMCISCQYSETVRGLVVHMSKLGKVPKSGEETMSGDVTSQMANISYDKTLVPFTDLKCPTCKSPLRGWFSSTSRLYTYLCPRCNQAVHPH